MTPSDHADNRADNHAYNRADNRADNRPQRPWTYAALILLLGLGACSTSGGRPTVQGLEVSAPGQNELIFSGVQGAVSGAQTLTLRNTGDAPLTIYTLALGGPDADAFRLAAPGLPLTLAPGGSAESAVSFAPGAPGTFSASLEVASSDPVNASAAVALYGLGSAGEGGELEPTLAQVAQTLGYGVDVGGDGGLGVGAEVVGSEISATLFEQAGDGPVTVTVVARYGPEEALPYGFFTLEGAKPVRREVGRVAAGDAQELLPPRAAGAEGFDPGGQAFGLYAEVGGGQAVQPGRAQPRRRRARPAGVPARRPRRQPGRGQLPRGARGGRQRRLSGRGLRAAERPARGCGGAGRRRARRLEKPL